jgi:hypothetical protein
MKSIAGVSKILMIPFILTLYACQSKPDIEALRSEILDLHKRMIEAHWEKDVGFFSRDISDHYFSVGNGEIRRPAREEIAAEFADYLKTTNFTEYRDLQDPIIGLSKDGSLAWSVVQVKVAGKRASENGTDRDLGFICAWITLYERQGKKWVRLGEASSFK